jgi:hypothetical protein
MFIEISSFIHGCDHDLIFKVGTLRKNLAIVDSHVSVGFNWCVSMV